METQLQAISNYSRDFDIEINQINYWIQTLNDVKKQIDLIKEVIDSETKLYETLGKSLQIITKGFINDSVYFTDEPSNLNNVYSNFINLIEYFGKTFCEDILMLNVHSNKYYSVIINETSSVKRSIIETSTSLINEIQDLKKKSKNIQSKYAKIKLDLEEAHSNKKKIENDPKYVYNVTLKEKAEVKIIDYIKQMQEMMPDVEKCSKDIETKKEAFNTNMMESFELVISNIFTHNIKINQTFFLLNKEKFDIIQNIKKKSAVIFKNITTINLQLNDYVDRKYAEKKQIQFESIEFLIIDENVYDARLINICDTILNYSTNFYNCMKLRKRAFQVFSRLILDYSKSEEIIASNYSKLNKNIIQLMDSINLIGLGSKKICELFKDTYDKNFNLHETFSKFLCVNICTHVTNISKETKSDYTDFNNILLNKSKEIINFKLILQKFNTNKNKIQAQIKDLRSLFNNGKIDKKKYESKLKVLSDEENVLTSSFDDTGKKIILFLSNTLDLLKKTIKILRNKEFKRFDTLIERILSVGKFLEKIFDNNLEYSRQMMNLSVSVDIYDEIKQIFENYFTKFKINNYQSFLEKIIRKLLIKIDFDNLDFGENISQVLNNYFNNEVKNANFINNRNLNKFDSGGFNSNNNISARDLTREINLDRKNKKIEFDEDEISLINKNDYENLDNNKIFDLNYENYRDQRRVFTNPGVNLSFNVKNSRAGLTQRKNEMISNDLNNANNQNLSYDNNINFYRSASITNSNAQEDEKINFVNFENFNVIDIKNPYQTLKENELKEYLEKINKKSAKNISNTNPIDASSQPSQEMAISSYVMENKNYVSEKIFPVEADEKVYESFSCAYQNKILLQGKLYVTNKKIVFYSWFNNKTLFGHTKLFIPIADIVKTEKKYHLKIFDNSINIVTKKTELFFTSFVYRNSCYKLIHNLINELKKNEEKLIESDDDSDESIDNLNLERNSNSNKKMNLISLKLNYLLKMFKKIDFYSKLEKVHQIRLNEFEKESLITCFRPKNSFPRVYFDDEPIDNCPLPLVYLQLFDKDTICEEMGKEKNFWESIYESKNDINLVRKQISENQNTSVPKFFEDLDYFISIFSNPEEDILNNFLEDIKNWPKTIKYSYSMTHPIKKKLIGPDKVDLKEEYTIYFVSPKMFVAEIICYGYNFPYSDTFITITQYKFQSNYKFNSNEGIFNYNTTCTLMFQIQFVKSCFFKGMIEEESYKESLENLKLNNWEKIRFTLDTQKEIFNQHFEKLSEEKMRKTMNKFFETQHFQVNGNNFDQEKINESMNDEMENVYDKLGYKIMKENDLCIQQSNSNNFKKIMIGSSSFGFVIIFTYFILINFDLKLPASISIDKTFNIVTIFMIGFLFYKFDLIMKQKQR